MDIVCYNIVEYGRVCYSAVVQSNIILHGTIICMVEYGNVWYKHGTMVVL